MALKILAKLKKILAKNAKVHIIKGEIIVLFF